MLSARQSRQVLASEVTAVLLVTFVFVAACAGSPPQHAGTPAKTPVAASSAVTTAGSTATAAHRTDSAAPVPPPAPTPAPTVAGGTAGVYGTGERQPMTFTEPAHTGVTGQYLGERSLVTVIWYPVARGSSGSEPASGPFPLLMFAPGYVECISTYRHLLQTWASAGYVVAAVTFPRTNCEMGAAADEQDLVNQPADVSYVLGRLLALNAQPDNFFSGLLDPSEVAAAGQSDGGNTVAAMAANTCCRDRDHQLKAVAVLSGAEWPFPGRYFPGGAPPMLFVQGSADTTNPPSASVQLYRADKGSPRYYLDLFGASHMGPYSGDNSVERLVARVTLAFFARYVLGDAGALTTMTKVSDGSGTAALDSGGQLPFGAG